jgi:hypothetical protein
MRSSPARRHDTRAQSRELVVGSRKKKEIVVSNRDAVTRVSDAIMSFVSRIPATRHRKRAKPGLAAKATANRAAAHAALAAGTLALPPGPLGWVTILPEMLAVWKIQAQAVSDIAAVYGKKSSLTQEQMIYCLFRHAAAQAVRDLVVRVGERVLVRRASLRLMQSVAERVGVSLTQKAIGKSVSRWVPVIGAVGVGGYAFYDTLLVAKTAMELFSSEIRVESPASDK